VFVAAAVLVFKRALLLLLLLLLGLFFRKRARFSFLKNRFPDLSFLRCSNETQISLSFSLKKQDNAEVHFKVKMGTKFKKVRVRECRFILLRKTTRRELDERFLQPLLKALAHVFSLSLSCIHIYEQNRSSTRSCSANLSNPGPFDSYSTGRELERTKRRKSWTWKTATRWTS